MTLGEQLQKQQAKMARLILLNNLLKKELTDVQIEKAERDAETLLPLQQLVEV